MNVDFRKIKRVLLLMWWKELNIWSGVEQNIWQEQIRIDGRWTYCDGDHELIEETEDGLKKVNERHSKGNKGSVD